MTNIPINPKLANLQKFYNRFPMQKHVAAVLTHMKAIEYNVPDVFIDIAIRSAQRVIERDNLPMVIERSNVLSTYFIVKEIAA